MAPKRERDSVRDAAAAATTTPRRRLNDDRDD